MTKSLMKQPRKRQERHPPVEPGASGLGRLCGLDALKLVRERPETKQFAPAAAPRLLAGLPRPLPLALPALRGVDIASAARAQALGVTHRLLCHRVAPQVESANQCNRCGRPTLSGLVMAKADCLLERNADGKKSIGWPADRSSSGDCSARRSGYASCGDNERLAELVSEPRLTPPSR